MILTLQIPDTHPDPFDTETKRPNDNIHSRFTYIFRTTRSRHGGGSRGLGVGERSREIRVLGNYVVSGGRGRSFGTLGKALFQSGLLSFRKETKEKEKEAPGFYPGLTLGRDPDVTLLSSED